MNHSKTNYTTKIGNGKYITKKERYKIEALKKAGVKNSEIAIQINKSERTIRRELKRGTVQLKNSDWTDRYEYCEDVAQRKYEDNAQNKGVSIKIGKDHELASYIEEKIIKDKYSPDAVIGEIRAPK